MIAGHKPRHLLQVLELNSHQRILPCALPRLPGYNRRTSDVARCLWLHPTPPMSLGRSRCFCDSCASFATEAPRVAGESESSCDRCASVLRQERQVNLFRRAAELARCCTKHEGHGVCVAAVARIYPPDQWRGTQGQGCIPCSDDGCIPCSDDVVLVAPGGCAGALW